MISIISPFKNVEKFIEPFIFSIKQQSFKNWELILIDDQSNDRSFKIAEKYVSNKIKIVKNKKNIGLGPSRNIGLHYSRYDYVMFVDSDDMISKNFLGDMFRLVEKKNYDFVISYARRCDENGENYRECQHNQKLFKLKISSEDFIFQKLPNRICGHLIRKKFLFDNKIFFSKLNIVHEDLYFTPLIFKKINNYSFLKTKKSFYIWRDRPGSLSNLMTKRRYFSLLILPWLNIFNYSGSLKYKLFNLKKFFYFIFFTNLNYCKILFIIYIKNLLSNFDFFYIYGEKKLSRLISNFFRVIKYRNIKIFKYFDKNLKYIDSLKKKYSNEDAIIICNGPSLKKINLKKIKNKIKLGFNAIYLNKDLNIEYHLIEDVLVAEDRQKDLKRLKLSNILIGNYLAYLFSKEFKQFKWFNVIYDFNDKKKNWPKFSKNAGKKMYTGGTVTYLALQLAYYMGFKRIFIIGMDHHYKINREQILQKGSNILLSKGKDINHFNDKYFGKGYRWHVPRTDRMLKAYKKSMIYFNQKKIKVFRVSQEKNRQLPFKHISERKFYEMLLQSNIKHKMVV